MDQSEDRDFKVIPTAVSTWGPRIPPAVGTSQYILIHSPFF